MRKRRAALLTAVLVAASVTVTRAADEAGLYAPQFPERTTVKLDFAASPRAPSASLVARVTYRDGQAQVELNYSSMKPAVLFGGDVTCYVVWAVTRDGTTENLGELTTPSPGGTEKYGTALKSFALMVTAEPYFLVSEPSSMLMFHNTQPTKKNVRFDEFTFSAFEEPPEHALEGIADVAWDSDKPLELVQAEKAFELAGRVGGDEYASGMMEQASIALAQARNLAAAKKSKKDVSDYARRSVSASNDAIGISLRKIEAAELEAEIASRRAEMEGLEARAGEAETSLDAAREETASLAEERSQLEAAMTALRTEQVALLATVGTLKGEKDELSFRLEDALSEVADTRSSARGMIVNLPDILFDVNESTLKDGAKLVIAKLAGILLIMGDLNLRIEGHTDSTGSLDWNQELSEKRAGSVREFLVGEGIDADRMIAVGYGPARPIDDNATREGRSRNRRVEIIIAEGEIAEADAAGE